MHQPKSGQGFFSELGSWLYPSKVERLKNSWAGPFREHILPLLIESEENFAHLYSENMGAPNKPVSVVMGILILKEMNDMTDRATLEEFEYNMQWHYALDVASNSHVCEKTLFNFRNRLMDNDALMDAFNEIVKGIIKKWRIKTGAHRIDSTTFQSNMKILSRLELFQRTIQTFLWRLKKEKPGVYDQLEEKYKTRYMEREGYFGDVKPSRRRRRLQECAQDLCDLVSFFRLNKKARNMKSFKLMERLLEEQVHVNRQEDGSLSVWLRMPDKKENDAEPEKETALKNPKEIGGDSLQNPSDPDATYSGHKKKQGYKAQISETCDEENPFQVIDDVKVEKAYESDQDKAEKIHEDLTSRGIKPETTYADGGYTSGENIVKAKDRGVELVGPLPGKESKETSEVEAGDFEYNETYDEIKRCPEGQAPVDQEYDEKSQTIEADFDAKKCEECSKAQKCPAKKKKRVRKIKVKRADAAKSKRRREEKTRAFKEKYKIRSGIEATISHLKNDMGMRRLSVRGSPSVSLRVIFKTLAHNARRMSNYVLHTMRSAQGAPHKRAI